MISNDEVIHSNLSDKCKECLLNCTSISEVSICPMTNKKSRRGVLNQDRNSIYLCSNSDEHLKSSSLFKKYLKNYFRILPDIIIFRDEIKGRMEREFKRLTHNIKTFNAQSSQELYVLFPQEISRLQFKDQFEKIEEIIQKKPKEVSILILKLIKNSKFITNEFNVYEHLYAKNPTIKRKNHKVRDVFMNITHTFFSDFLERDILIEIEDFSSSAMIDYETVAVVFSHLMDNAVKYCLPSSNIFVKFSEDKTSVFLILNMISYQIRDDELLSIFNEGFSGHFPKLLKADGDGIGMFIVKKFIEMNKGNIEIRRNVNINYKKVIHGIVFENNEFVLRFSKF